MGADRILGDVESSSCVNIEPPMNPVAPVRRIRGGDDDEAGAAIVSKQQANSRARRVNRG